MVATYGTDLSARLHCSYGKLDICNFERYRKLSVTLPTGILWFKNSLAQGRNLSIAMWSLTHFIAGYLADVSKYVWYVGKKE